LNTDNPVRDDPESEDFEDDEDQDDGPKLAGGETNYITPQGFKMLEEERHQLLRVDRPKVVEIVSWAASNGDRSENGDYIYGKKRLRQIDGRIRFLNKRLKIAIIINPSEQKNHDQIFFGATVTYVRENGEDGEDGKEVIITIVGVDEADLTKGKISWVSPVAKALFKAYEGDSVNIRTPSGIVPIEIISIAYDET